MADINDFNAAMAVVNQSLGNAVNALNVGIGSRDEMYRAERINRGMMKYSSELQAAEWDRQFKVLGDYNSPFSQLERLYDANINPLYSSAFSGTSSAGISASAPSGSVGYAPSRSVSMDSSALLGLKQLEIASKNADSQALSARADARLKGVTADRTQSMTPYEIDESLARLRGLNAKSDLDAKEMEKIDADISALSASLSARTRELEIASDDLDLRRDQFNYEKTARTFSNSTDRMQAEASLMNADTNAKRLEADSLHNKNMQWLEGERVGHERLKFKKEIELKTRELEILERKSYVDLSDNVLNTLLGFVLGSRVRGSGPSVPSGGAPVPPSPKGLPSLPKALPAPGGIYPRMIICEKLVNSKVFSKLPLSTRLDVLAKFRDLQDAYAKKLAKDSKSLPVLPVSAPAIGSLDNM